MPVVWGLNPKGSSAYNIPPGPDVDLETLTKAKIIEDPHDIAILSPQLDTITLSIRGGVALQFLKPKQTLEETTAISSEFWGYFFQQLLMLSGDPQCPWLFPAKQNLPGYKINLQIKLNATDGVVKINAWPKNLSKSPLRIEFSAARMAQLDINELAEKLDEITYGEVPFRALLIDARVTRADAAVDIVNLGVADIFACHEKLWKIWTASSHENGFENQQLYLKSGLKKPPTWVSPKKRSDMLIYDKRVQSIAIGGEPKFGKHPYTRIEASCSTKTFFRNLHKAKSPFDGWMFRRPKTMQGKFDHGIWRMFFDSAKSRGLDEAKKLLPDPYGSEPFIMEEEFWPNDLIDADTWKAWPQSLNESSIGKWLEWANTPIEKLLPGMENSLPI